MTCNRESAVFASLRFLISLPFCEESLNTPLFQSRREELREISRTSWDSLFSATK
jgi:hypothetical protein